ncbi:MAG: NUDIX hydrolase [Acidimicrobiales bacterium]
MRRIHLGLLKLYRRMPVWARRFTVRRLSPTFTVGSICIVERTDGAILLVRHSYRNRWGFPGGLLARGESPLEAAHREAMEEVGLPIEVDGEPVVVVAAVPRRVDVIFRCRPKMPLGEVRPGSPEIVEAQWFPLRDLPELQPEASGALVALARRDGEEIRGQPGRAG